LSFCGKCGKQVALDLYPPPRFCSACGAPLNASQAAKGRSRPSWLGVWDIIALLSAFAFWKTGAGVLGGLVVFVLVDLVGILLVTAWLHIVKPVGHKAREEGLAGIGGYLYRKVIVPVLYGSRGKR
jgi:hypothetical protein